MAPLYKRYIPPKPSDTAPPAPKPVSKVSKPVPAPEPVSNKRKRERTDEEVAERKAKKLRKKGIDPATVTQQNQPAASRASNPKAIPVSTPVSAPTDVPKDESAGPVFEPQGTFKDVKHSGKRHKLEKQAREARRTAALTQTDESNGGSANGYQKPQDGALNGTNGDSVEQLQKTVVDVHEPRKDGGTQDNADVTIDVPKSKKKEKRKKEQPQPDSASNGVEPQQASAPEAPRQDETLSQPKKRRHKLESVLKSASNDVTEDPGGSQENLKKHGGILKKFQQASKLSQNAPQVETATEQDETNRVQPVILDLAPLPQPEKAPTPDFVPDEGALPVWIAKPTVVTNDDGAPFSSLGLEVKAVEHLSKLRFNNALPVQKAVIPLLLPPSLPGARFLPGSESVLPDIAVSAPTGSGKTVAYLLPIVESLKQATGLGQLKALIVVPTRELVTQVAAVADSLARGTSLKVGTATGSGTFKDEQFRLIKRGRKYDPKGYADLIAQADRRNYPPEQGSNEDEDSFEPLEEDDAKQEQRISDTVSGLQAHVPTYESAFDILVATPGRLLEHLKSTLGFSLAHLEWLVLDEADKLLDLQYDGFLDAINNEISRPRNEDEQDVREQYLRPRHLWEERRERRIRKVVLSATMTKDISKLLELKLQRPQMVVVRGAEQDSSATAAGAMPEGGEAVKELEDGFELPPTLSEYCVPVGDGSEKPLFLVELLQTHILGDGSAKPQDDASDSSSTTSSTSSDSDSDAATPADGDSEDEQSDDEADKTIIPSPGTMEIEQPTIHPSRAALLTHTNAPAPTILIFTSSTESTARLSHLLKHLNPTSAPWITTMTRSTRASLPHSDASKPVITVSTDRAARGLDALGTRAITHVVQYDVPRSTTGYVHRVGRTARAGRRGEAWTLYSHAEARWFMKEVAKTGKIKRGREVVEKVKLAAPGEEGRESLGEVVRGMREEVMRGGKRSKKLKDPSKKYRKFTPLKLANRQWPSKTLDAPPRWLATDLRDGNQSLVDPMDGEQKWRYFALLVQLGYKEIEISYPSSGPTDFDFTTRLVKTPGVVPDDVWLQVLSPCRKELIRKTVDSLKGAKKAILHLYVATSPCFQQVVFGMDNKQQIELAVECTRYARSITKDDPESGVGEWMYEFSPETFSDSDPGYVIELCEAVKTAWGPSEQEKIIFNLPATVEMSTPNVYADQIEYFCTKMTEREKICVSLHPHNDRGCAVAAAELAQMAGADRVEGTLFGNGERTGNVDLVTLALNLYTQGIHPGIDFSDINSVIEIVEKSNKIPVHPRAPYGGELVCCAFSGSHQDAIKKGFSAREAAGLSKEDPWKMPYLPLDPQDIGRNYEAIIRVNSQSGKGGVAWIIKRTLELDLPRGLQVVFSKIVQKETDMLGRELQATEIKDLFIEAYHLQRNPRFHLVDYEITADRSASPAPPEPASSNTTAAKKTASSTNLRRRFKGVIDIDGTEHEVVGYGNGALSSLANALKDLGIDLDLVTYTEHAIGAGSGGIGTKAATYIECTNASDRRSVTEKEKVWGVGVHQDVVQASLIALLSAASSFLSSRPTTPVPFRPKRSDTHSLSPGAGLNEIRESANGAPDAGPDVKEGSEVVAKLEDAAAETESSSEVGTNGHAS